MLKHFRSKVLWGRGITAWGGCAEGCEMASDSICFIGKMTCWVWWANTWSCVLFLTPSTPMFFFNCVLLWEGTWDSGYYLLWSWVLALKFRHTPGCTPLIMKSIEVTSNNASHQTGRGIDFPCLHFLLRRQLADWFLSHFQPEIERGSGEGRGGRERGERREEGREEEREKGKGQVKQKSKWSWVN